MVLRCGNGLNWMIWQRAPRTQSTSNYGNCPSLSGKGALGEGKLLNNRVKVENNLKPAKLQTNVGLGDKPWFQMPNHPKVWAGKEGWHLQNKITIKKILGSTSGLLKDRIHRTATRESDQKLYCLEWATCVPKFKPKVAHTSDFKTTTVETCIHNKIWRLSTLNVIDNILRMQRFTHVCLPAKVFRSVSCLTGMGMERPWAMLTVWSLRLFSHVLMLNRELLVLLRDAVLALWSPLLTPLAEFCWQLCQKRCQSNQHLALNWGIEFCSFWSGLMFWRAL